MSTVDPQMSTGSNWNLPNALTTLRILMVPFFGWALLVDGGDSVLWRCVAYALFIAAMVTDKIDGDIARSRNLVTNFAAQWLYLRNPALREEGKNPFTLDSNEPTASFQDFIRSEVRFSSLLRQFPDSAESLMAKAEIGGAMVVIMVWRPRGLVSSRTPSVALGTRRAIAARGPSGAVLGLYPLWCAFATLLSTRIWQLNR